MLKTVVGALAAATLLFGPPLLMTGVALLSSSTMTTAPACSTLPAPSEPPTKPTPDLSASERNGANSTATAPSIAPCVLVSGSAQQLAQTLVEHRTAGRLNTIRPAMFESEIAATATGTVTTAVRSIHAFCKC